MKPAQTTRSGLCSGDPRGERPVPGVPGGVIGEFLDEGRYPGAFGPGQPLDAVAVGADRHDPGAVGLVGRSVQQGL